MSKPADFLPAPEFVTGLSPEEVGKALLRFFGSLEEPSQRRNAMRREYIAGSFPVKDYPANLQNQASERLGEGWAWLERQGFIVLEARDSYKVSSQGQILFERMKKREAQLVIFYSWQSDLPNATNRGFIQDCLERAIKGLGKEGQLALEPVIDRDTVGVTGTPDIVSTILEKIDNSDLFVCDVSIVTPGPRRATPNPNVLVELGYALKALTPDFVACVANTNFGRIEDLPFDIRQRRIIAYTLQEGEDKANARTSLVRTLTDLIQATIARRQS